MSVLTPNFAASPRLVMMVVMCAVASVGRGAEILKYQDATSVRKESGQPGSRVTGEWSWMDKGELKKIWYVADANGFRAFGDLVPSTNWAKTPEGLTPVVGASVVPPMSARKGLLRDEAPKRRITTPQPLSATASSGPGGAAGGTRAPRTPVPPVLGIGDTSVSHRETIEPPRVAEPSQAVRTLIANETGAAPSRGEEGKMSPGGFIPGTSFVLLSNTRLPIQHKLAAPRANQIRPRPVEVTGAPPSPIRGILSAPRAINVLDRRRAKDLGTSEVRRKVPRPSKVEGVLNLDNFLRPSHPAPTPKESHPQAHQGANQDYFYHDYYYYDTRPERRGPRTRAILDGPESAGRSDETSESLEEEMDFVDESSDETTSSSQPGRGRG